MNDSLSTSAFCNLALEDEAPDHNIVSHFRTHLTQCGAFDQLLLNINTQLEAKHLMVKTVTKIDAFITDTPRQLRGHKTYEIDAKDTAQQYDKPSVDQDVSWIKKVGRTGYGYKKHIITDDEGL